MVRRVEIVLKRKVKEIKKAAWSCFFNDIINLVI
jgi:hypothetical protein